MTPSCGWVTVSTCGRSTSPDKPGWRPTGRSRRSSRRAYHAHAIDGIAMRVLRIDHVNIRTPLFDETLAFYEACLGLVRGPCGSARHRRQNAWLYGDDGTALVHVNGPEPGEPVADAGCQSRLQHFALACEGLDAWRTRLRQQSVAFQELALPGRGLVQLNLVDPNGIAIELTFPAPSSV